MNLFRVLDIQSMIYILYDKDSLERSKDFWFFLNSYCQIMLFTRFKKQRLLILLKYKTLLVSINYNHQLTNIKECMYVVSYFDMHVLHALLLLIIYMLFIGCVCRRIYKHGENGKGCDGSSTAPPCTG